MASNGSRKTIRQKIDSVKKALENKGLRNFPVTNVEPGTEGKGALGIGTLLPRPALRNYEIRTNDQGNNIVSLSSPANSTLFFVTYKNQLVPGDDGQIYSFVIIRTLNPTTPTDVQSMLGSTKQPAGTIISVIAITEQQYSTNTFQHPVYLNQNKQPLTIPYAAISVVVQNTPGRLDNVPIGYPDFDTTRSPVTARQGMLPMPPYPDFSTNNGVTGYAVGSTVGFLDTSLTNPTIVSPTGWIWSFTGPNDVSPSGSTAQNPVINFGEAGEYTVSLTASNQNGSKTITKTDYILIGSIAPGNFTFTVQTDNVGTSNSNQFTLPLISSSTPDMIVYWGDGTYDRITSYNQAEVTHTYPTAGKYLIAISGTINGWQFADGGDKLKMLNIFSWGGFDVSVEYGFRGCTNLTSSATDVPTITTTSLRSYFQNCSNFNGNLGNWDVSNVTNFQDMFLLATSFNNGGSSDINNWNTGSATNFQSLFFGSSSFNQPINNWNTSSATNMSIMFYNATAFNQDISDWDTSRATNMSEMFRGATAFNQDISDWDISNVSNFTNFMTGKSSANYDNGYLDNIYNKWSLQSVQSGINISFGSIQWVHSYDGRNVLTSSPNNWTITDGGQIPFEFTMNTANTSTGSTSATQFKLPLTTSTGLVAIVDWGDGNTDTITSHTAPGVTHTYASSGTYTVKITGKLLGWQFNNSGDRLKMLDVKQWSGLNISTNTAFRGCSNLTATATDAPLITTTDLRSCFENCTNFNGAVGNWDVSNVTNMASVFEGCINFNQNIGAWDVSKVVGNSTVTGFFQMFAGATNFNNGGSSDINNWGFTTTGIVSFQEMFSYTKFNQPIGSWNTERVVNMSRMFQNNQSFNQDIGSWDVSNVTDMFRIFSAATAFNNGNSNSIGNWDTTSVTDMGEMFNVASSFNQNIGAWNVSKVTNFLSMFSNATAFNNGGSDDIDNWTFSTTSNINMSSMFSGTNTTLSCKFNRYIGSWNTQRVTNMSSMFARNTAFNQDIGGWNTSSVTLMNSMFSSASLFNKNIGSWNTSAVTDMNNMFSSSTFNQNIGAWNVSNVTSFVNMFGGNYAFNNGGSPDINNWVIKTTGTVNMGGMFGDTTFNQPIGNWNTSAVTNMGLMFRFNVTFNQDISDWNIANVTSFNSFMDGKSAANYLATYLDNIYNKWSLQAVQPNLTINFGSIKYTAAGQAGRDVLDNAPNNWTITDGGT